MKRVLRIPTNEQYSYIELELGDEEVLTQEAIDSVVDEYHRATRQIKGNLGISEKEMNGVVDKMLLGQTVEGGIELYERMDSEQQKICQVIKRALKRLEAKNK